MNSDERLPTGSLPANVAAAWDEDLAARRRETEEIRAAQMMRDESHCVVFQGADMGNPNGDRTVILVRAESDRPSRVLEAQAIIDAVRESAGSVAAPTVMTIPPENCKVLCDALADGLRVECQRLLERRPGTEAEMRLDIADWLRAYGTDGNPPNILTKREDDGTEFQVTMTLAGGTIALQFSVRYQTPRDCYGNDLTPILSARSAERARRKSRNGMRYATMMWRRGAYGRLRA